MIDGIGEWTGVTATGYSLHQVAREATTDELAAWRSWGPRWTSGWAVAVCGSVLVAPTSAASIKGRVLQARCTRCTRDRVVVPVTPQAVDAAVSELLEMAGALQN